MEAEGRTAGEAMDRVAAGEAMDRVPTIVLYPCVTKRNDLMFYVNEVTKSFVTVTVEATATWEAAAICTLSAPRHAVRHPGDLPYPTTPHTGDMHTEFRKRVPM